MAEQNLKQQTKKGLYWQFLNQFSNYAIQFIIGIFMARLLSPEDYGITALPGVFIKHRDGFLFYKCFTGHGVLWCRGIMIGFVKRGRHLPALLDRNEIN